MPYRNMMHHVKERLPEMTINFNPEEVLTILWFY
jgi:hypothetical protein